MLFQTGKSWVLDFFRHRGWLVNRRPKFRRRPSSWNPQSTIPAECLEERVLLSTITVTSLADTLNAGASNGVTLRDAIQAANTDARVDGSVAGVAGVQNVIVFAPGLTGTIKLGQGQLTISSTMEIDGLGAGKTIIDAHQNSRIFGITSAAGNVTLDGLTIENGIASDTGGAIQVQSRGTLSILNSTLTGNSTTGETASGGAVCDWDGTLTVTDCTLTGNSTIGDNAYGGALYSRDGAMTVTNSTLSGNSTTGQMACGGAVYDWSGALTVTNCLLSGNSTIGPRAYGGAIYSRSGAMTVTNSTLSGNSTSGASAVGGAIDSFDGSVTVTNSTLVQNHATNAAGGGIAAQQSAATITLRNTILAQNTDNGTAPDLYDAVGVTVTLANSLIGDNQGTGLTAAPLGAPDANGNLIGTAGAPIDPRLGSLAFNGGPTPTMALLPGSPALGAGNNAATIAAALTTGQPGFPSIHIINGTVDMGTYQTLNLVVNTLDDTLNAVFNSAHVTLRDAIAQASSHSALTTITFDAALDGNAVALVLTRLTVGDKATITWNGEANIFIVAQQNSPSLYVTGGTGGVTLDYLTLEPGPVSQENLPTRTMLIGLDGPLPDDNETRLNGKTRWSVGQTATNSQFNSVNSLFDVGT
jgi:CSLREA domain-containing protein